MKFFCIADKESGLGFKLAGIQTREVITKSEARESLAVAKADKQVGIILVTEKAADMLRGEIEAHITDNPIPLILEIPSRGEFGKNKSAADLLKELAGIGL